MKTDSGELSVRTAAYTHLSKSLTPLPEKFHGLTNVEERYRRRYVDLFMNEDSKRIAFCVLQSSRPLEIIWIHGLPVGNSCLDYPFNWSFS